MITKFSLAVCMAVLLAACTTVGTLNSTFDPNAAAFVKAQGKGTITGQAFLRRNDGIVVYGAGSDVILVPKTAYSDERFAQIYGSGKVSMFGRTFKNDDPTYYEFSRKTVADGEGRFVFDGVADGQYYLTTNVVWMVQYAQQGGALMERVTIKDGQPVTVIMSGQ
jgi:hypothetical protein